MHGYTGQYDNLGKIGEGTYGVVIKSRDRVSGQIVAIKKFKEYEDEEEVRKTANREIKMLRRMKHANIISLLDDFRIRQRLYLVFEYVEGTVLQELERYPHGLGDLRTRQIMWQLVSAVAYLHSQRIVHRDIKPENMLLSASGMLKLCDFGFAREVTARDFDMSEYVATRWYRAPELLVGDKCYGQAVDIWAIGCMLVEMQTGQPLFPGTDDTDQLWLILCSCTDEQLATLQGSPILQFMKTPGPHERERLEDKLPALKSEAINFLKSCLHPHPEYRRSAKELLQSQYLSGAEMWFNKRFRSLNENKGKQLRQSMSVERERGKPRHFRRCTDTRNVLGSDALNISPFRGRPMRPVEAGRQHQENTPHGKAGSLSTGGPLSRFAEETSSPCKASPLASTLPEAACHITSSKEGKKGHGNIINISAVGGPIFGSLDRPDEIMMDAPCTSDMGRGNGSVAPRRESQGEGAVDLRRSIRLQSHTENSNGTNWQGPASRIGQQFLSPDPRMARWRDPHATNGAQNLLRQSQAVYPSPHTSPNKGVPNWRVEGTGQAPAGGTPSLRQSMNFSQLKEHTPQGIPAYYGAHPAWKAENGQFSAQEWNNACGNQGSNGVPAGLQIAGWHQSQRWASPQPNGNGGREPASDSHSVFFHSPLRAHAPVFVPSTLQCLQGRKKEIHGSSSPDPTRP